jgi:hypothetical protein
MEGLLLDQGRILSLRPQIEANGGSASLTVIPITMPSQQRESFDQYGTEDNLNPAVNRH